MEFSKSNILCVGHVCVDIINLCSCYPEEDAKIGTNSIPNRCIDQRWQRGGNAANSCTVLGILGSNSYYCGSIAESYEKSFIMEDFRKYNINTNCAVMRSGCACPTSCVVLSEATGSRTIIHSNKDLPEVSVEEFAKIDFSLFSWIHFEGRNIPNLGGMISLVRQYNIDHSDAEPITISLEAEKARTGVDDLIPLPDVLFASKDFANSKGYSNMDETIEKLQALALPGATIICPWGEKGASGSNVKGYIVRSPAFPPNKVLDTLGAGDTFNAATIHSLSRGNSIEDSITFGCKIAGAKVGVHGWEPLQEAVKNIPKAGNGNNKYALKTS